MNLIFALLPIAIYRVILKMLDSFTLVRWMRLALCTAWGVVACGITIGIENMLAPPDADMTVMTGRTWNMAGGLVAGIAVHFVYNMFLLTSFVHIVAFVIILLVIFVIISECNERRIYRWMDHSITYDVQLLCAIRSGQLANTDAGKYLLSIKEQFEPEVFFDIICYMQLYLELVIKGKSRILMQQEGLAGMPTPEDQQRHREMLSELHTLRHNIGYMGIHVLRPIVRFNKEDLAILK